MNFIKTLVIGTMTSFLLSSRVYAAIITNSYNGTVSTFEGDVFSISGNISSELESQHTYNVSSHFHIEDDESLAINPLIPKIIYWFAKRSRPGLPRPVLPFPDEPINPPPMVAGLFPDEFSINESLLLTSGESITILAEINNTSPLGNIDISILDPLPNMPDTGDLFSVISNELIVSETINTAIGNGSFLFDGVTDGEFISLYNFSEDPDLQSILPISLFFEAEFRRDTSQENKIKFDVTGQAKIKSVPESSSTLNFLSLAILGLISLGLRKKIGNKI